VVVVQVTDESRLRIVPATVALANSMLGRSETSASYAGAASIPALLMLAITSSDVATLPRIDQDSGHQGSRHACSSPF